MAVEHAPDNRRGFYGSWPQLGAPLGLVLGTMVFTVMAAAMSDVAFMDLGVARSLPDQHRAGRSRPVYSRQNCRIASIPERSRTKSRK